MAASVGCVAGCAAAVAAGGAVGAAGDGCATDGEACPHAASARSNAGIKSAILRIVLSLLQ
jgi:hypothetical protein